MNDAVKRLVAMREAGTLVLLFLLVVVATVKEPRFLQSNSIESIILWVPLLALVGLGQMMVIVTRGIDVSVGSMMGLAGMIVAMTFRDYPGLNVYAGAGLGIGLGFVLGSLNGLLISWAKIPPIIATLGTLSAYRGLTFIVSGGRQVDSNDLPDALKQWSLGGPFAFGGVTIPWILIITLAIAAGAAWFLKKTRAGRDIYTLGSNPEAARLRGIPVGRTTFLVYAITGGLCGLAGVLYGSRYGFVNPGTAGSGMELLVIAAVVIGGTNVVGGSGTVLGVLLGALFLGAVNVALSVLGISETWQQLVYGIVILVAVLVDTGVRNKSEAAH